MPTPPSPLAELLSALARALGGLGLRWYLFGAQAAILHGTARLTADVDVTVDTGTHSIRGLVARLRDAGFEPRVSDADAFAASTRVLPLVHVESRIPVDIVLAGPGLEQEFLSRAETRSVGGTPVPVIAAEDLITMKVLAGRDKDLDDVVAVLTARGDRLDLDRIRSTLRLIERALERSDLVAELDRLVGRVKRDRD